MSLALRDPQRLVVRLLSPVPVPAIVLLLLAHDRLWGIFILALWWVFGSPSFVRIIDYIDRAYFWFFPFGSPPPVYGAEYAEPSEEFEP